jgi:ferritin
MGKLISDNLNSAICEQISHEQYNSSLYLYICGFLKNKGLDNLAKHFETQWKEESEHSKVFFDLLTDLNSPVIIPQVDEISIPLNTILDIGNTYLNREILTTTSINEIKKLAISEDNPVVEERMREMVKLQQNEYEEATTFLDNASLCGDDWWKVKVWNDSLG